MRVSDFCVEIFGDNPSFRIYKREKTHALLSLANVVGPFLYTYGQLEALIGLCKSAL